MCRCNERRKALANALKAVAQGDAPKIASELNFVTSTAIEDAAAAMKNAPSALALRVQAARIRLGGMRR